MADAVLGYQINANASGALGAFRQLRSAIAQSVQAARGLNNAVDPDAIAGWTRDAAGRLRDAQGRFVPMADQLAAGMGGFELSQQFDAMQNAGSRIAGFGQSIVGGISSVFGAASQASIDFTSSLSEVEKVSGLSGDKLAALGDSMIGLSTSVIPSTAIELADIAAAGGRLGLAADDLQTYVMQTAKMSTAFGMTTEQTGDAMAAIANGFGIFDAMTGKIDFARNELFGNTVNNLADSMATSEASIITATQRMAGNAVYGINENSSAALAAGMTAIGMAPEVAARAMNSVVATLASAPAASEKAQAGFKALGIDVNELQQRFLKKEGTEAFMDFLKTVKAKGPEAGPILTSIFGMGFSDEVLRSANGIEQFDLAFRKVNEAAQGKGSTLDGALEVMTNTGAAQLALLKNSVTALAMELGNLLLPIIVPIAKALRFALNGITAFAQAYPLVGKIVVAFGLVGLAIGSVIAIVGTLIMFLGAVGAAITSLAAPATIAIMGATIAGISTVFSGLVATVTGVGAAIGGIFTMSLPALVGGIGGAIGAVAGAIGTFLTGVLLPLLPWIIGIGLAALLIRKYWQPIKVFFGGVFSGFQEGLKPAFDILKEFGGWIKSLFVPLLTILGVSFDLANDQAMGSFSGVEEFGRRVGQVLGFIVGIPVYIVDSLRLFVIDVGKLLGVLSVPFAPGFTFGDVGNEYTAFLENITGKNIDSFGEAIAGVAKGYQIGFTNLFDGLDQQLGTETTNPLEGVGTMLYGYVDGFKAFLDARKSGELLRQAEDQFAATKAKFNRDLFWFNVGNTFQTWRINSAMWAQDVGTHFNLFWMGVGYTIRGWWIQTQAIASMAWTNVVTFWQGIGYTIQGWWIQTQANISIAWSYIKDLFAGVIDWLMTTKAGIGERIAGIGTAIVEFIQQIKTAFATAFNTAKSAITNLVPFGGGGGATTGKAAASSMTGAAMATGATTSTVVAGSTDNSASNTVNVGGITVNGAGDPELTGKAINRELNNQFNAAQEGSLGG